MSAVSRDKIIYVYPARSSFILRDIELLSQDYAVREFFFDVSNKRLVPWQFIRQFFFLMTHMWRAKAIVCHFAGYSSWLPTLLGSIFRKTTLVIVAGNDGSRFPDFRYGNYTRKLLGIATGQSLVHATHVLPVHESLFFQDYNYYEGGKPAQGYSYFYPKAAKTPWSPVYYGYDSTVFRILPDVERIPNTYLTIGNLADSYCFKRKGYDLILELARLRPECNFTLVGWDGKTDLQAPSNVRLLPFMNQADIIRTFNKHQFYLQLSIMEGFPNALAEAMLCGCVPIGSDVSAIPSMIADTGFVLRHRDVNELSAIVDAINVIPADELNRLSLAARERVATHYTAALRRERLVELISRYS